jgi:conjugative relaxase-like TrwC/TraI family protein
MVNIGTAAPFIYYEKESQGHWIGVGSRLLGLPAITAADKWNEIRAGNHPETGEQLRPIKNVDRAYERVTKEGVHFKKVYQAWNMRDICVSAPKSVSIQAVIDPRIRRAHYLAVDSLVFEMEKKVGPMVIARFDHERNREGQPQLHTHLVAANLSFNNERWRRLNIGKIYLDQENLTAHYRERVLERIERLGYRIEYPEIAGLSEAIREKYSDRSRVREQFIKEHIEMNGKEPTKKEIAVRMQQDRRPKEAITQDAIRQRQLDAMSAKEKADLFALKESADNNAEENRVHIRETNRPDHPWMAWSGGVFQLDLQHLASAQRSYERWQHKGEHSFSDYVQFTQERWAENPGLLERWHTNRQQVEHEMSHQRLRLEDRPANERPAEHLRWTYGENPRVRMGL